MRYLRKIAAGTALVLLLSGGYSFVNVVINQPKFGQLVPLGNLEKKMDECKYDIGTKINYHLHEDPSYYFLDENKNSGLGSHNPNLKIIDYQDVTATFDELNELKEKYAELLEREDIKKTLEEKKNYDNQVLRHILYDTSAMTIGGTALFIMWDNHRRRRRETITEKTENLPIEPEN